MPTPEEITREFRKIYLRVQASFNRKYRDAFDKVITEFSLLANDPNIKFTRSYQFAPSINKKMTSIITEFHDDILTLTEGDIEDIWLLSNQKNDRIVNNYLKAIETIKANQKAAYMLPNIQALKAFIGRGKNTETLSDAIWKVSKQLRSELETHLGIGITNGDSAQVISQRIRKYLENPDALFRRVRNKNGRLVASQKMINFRKDNKLTQGTYTSAYKNALRVTRTETNMAYMTADHLRWLQMDMVVGVRISLSAQHPDYNFPEICEILEGDYPKTFFFRGWHPQCLCNEVPIMMPQNDFKAYLKGNLPLKAEQIKEMPNNFIEHIKSDFERYSNYKNTPYFIADNQKIINQILKEK
jgi:hypothetical protein